MKKLILQSFIGVLLFFSTWFALAQIDWVSVFRIEKLSNQTEEKLGNIFGRLSKKPKKKTKILM